MRLEALVLEAEALDLVEILCGTQWVHIVRRNPHNFLVRKVFSRVEGEGGLTREDRNL